VRSHPERRPGKNTLASTYEALACVEPAFRAFNTVSLDIRPIRHRTEQRVRAQVFLRMISYYLTWHMQACLAPIMFTDHDKPAAQATRPNSVAPRPAPATRDVLRTTLFGVGGAPRPTTSFCRSRSQRIGMAAPTPETRGSCLSAAAIRCPSRPVR
jgi:hypothetical protein